MCGSYDRLSERAYCLTQDIKWEFVVTESTEIQACVDRGEYVTKQ